MPNLADNALHFGVLILAIIAGILGVKVLAARLPSTGIPASIKAALLSV